MGYEDQCMMQNGWECLLNARGLIHAWPPIERHSWADTNREAKPVPWNRCRDQAVVDVQRGLPSEGRKETCEAAAL